MQKIVLIKENEFLKTGWPEEGLKIVTHNGLFHADEVLSVALLAAKYDKVFILRTRNKDILRLTATKKEVYLLDVGGEYNPDLRCFDHHSNDKSMEDHATISLIFKFLYPENTAINKFIYDRLIDGVKNWDNGRKKSLQTGMPLNLSQLISSFNSLDAENQDIQFIKALRFSGKVIENEFRTAEILLKSQKIYVKRNHLTSMVMEVYEPCPFWRVFFDLSEDLPYFLQPGFDTWTLTSINSTKYPIPSFVKKYSSFVHPSGFMASFSKREDALKFVLEMEKRKLE
jgi:uncharacterized UPF0160 family protein